MNAYDRDLHGSESTTVPAAVAKPATTRAQVAGLMINLFRPGDEFTNYEVRQYLKLPDSRENAVGNIIRDAVRTGHAAFLRETPSTKDERRRFYTYEVVNNDWLTPLKAETEAAPPIETPRAAALARKPITRSRGLIQNWIASKSPGHLFTYDDVMRELGLEDRFTTVGASVRAFVEEGLVEKAGRERTDESSRLRYRVVKSHLHEAITSEAPADAGETPAAPIGTKDASEIVEEVEALTEAAKAPAAAEDPIAVLRKMQAVAAKIAAGVPAQVDKVIASLAKPNLHLATTEDLAAELVRRTKN